MVNREKIKQLVKIYLTHTEMGKADNIDVNDLNLYIRHAYESGLINDNEIYKSKSKLQT